MTTYLESYLHTKYMYYFNEKMRITNREPSQKYIKRNRYSKQSIFDREGTIERFSLGVCLAIASYFLIDTMNNNKLKLFWRNKC